MRAPPFAAFTLCTFIWGTTWLAIKVGYGGLDAVWGASLRFFIAGLVLLAWIVARRIPLPQGPRPVAVVAFVGLVLFGVDYGLIYWGEQFIPSGLTAILFATTPLLVALMTPAIMPRERVTPRQVVGVLVSLGGLLLIFGPEFRLEGAAVGPMVAIVGAAAAAAASTLVVRRWGRDIAPSSLTAGAMLVGAAALLAASVLAREQQALPATGSAWAALLYLVVFGSVVGFLLYWDLLRLWDAHRASLITILTPVVAVATGLVVGERLTAAEWLGSGLVLAGVALSLVRAPTHAPVRAPAGAGGR